MNTAEFQEKCVPDPVSGCWNWTGSLKSTGYGRLTLAGKYWAAHRLAYVLFKGPIPDGKEIDHLCRNRRCVNFAHLEAVSHGVNCWRSPLIRERSMRQAQQANERKKHSALCVNGHPRAPGAKCRECARVNARERYLAVRTSAKPYTPYGPRHA